jgi:hypothetical protein
MTIHYDTTIKPILKLRIIPPNKPLWLLVLYLIHQEKNYLRSLQQWFQRHGKLLSKEKNYLNKWNEPILEAKLDVFYTDYFIKQKKHRVE